jgi:proline dehydrogenase
MSVVRKALFPIAQRFVAGETRHSVIERVERLNEKGLHAMVDLLGEHVKDEEAADRAVEAYDDLLSAMDTQDLDASLSVKPTHLGLEIGYAVCRDNLEYLVRRAEMVDRFVWIDMESSAHTEETIQLYEELLEEHDNVGLCIQCYLRRSEDDVERLLEHDNAVIRLVKGAYKEPEDKAFVEKEEMDENYRRLLRMLFESDNRFAVATHDMDLIRYAKQLEDQHDRDRDSYEYQFLLGVCDEFARDLADKGYRVGEYVPYGEEWLSYYWRRVRERKENLLFAVRAVFGV